jgi:mono/diheme cytochrome c family protein
MKSLASRALKTSLVASVFVGALCTLAACGSKTPAPTTDPDPVTVVDPRVLPARSFSGFDGKHTFQVPIAVYSALDDLVVTASPASLAKVEPANPPPNVAAGDAGRYFLITALGAGEVDLTATSKGVTRTVKLSIARYDATKFGLGEQRYGNGNTTEKEPACASCHQRSGGPDHSPTVLSGVADAAIRNIIVDGLNGDRNIPNHAWTVTEEEALGLTAYLRGLPPKGYTTK